MASIPPVLSPLDRFFPLRIPLVDGFVARCDGCMTRLQEATPPGGGTDRTAAVARRGTPGEDPTSRREWRTPKTPTTAFAPAASAPGHAAATGFEVDFLPAEFRVGQMRRIAAAHLRHWHLTALTHDVALAVSELVTNAVQHAEGTPVGLRIWRAAHELRIEVTDGSPMPARPRRAGEADESGRGLLLVAAIAKEWGTSPDGTMTWCSLTIPEGRS
ncbi:ATP-binding protein [Streptomyces venezuelae]|uniref:ATP-binding protein n=1 Tax=Streptomyces venezuelae TaxID=54571 RepID=UPI0037B8FFFA